MDEEIVAFMEDMRYITIEDTIKIYKNINQSQHLKSLIALNVKKVNCKVPFRFTK